MDSFDHFFKTPEINMLNAALPYVSDHMGKSLALYIKSTEMQRILSDFDKEELLSACGYESGTPDPEAMLKAMKQAGGPNVSPQIDQILQMMHMAKTYQKFNELLTSHPELMSLLTNQNNFSAPPEPQKQHNHTDSSDIMSLLTQMLKNSR